MSNNERKVEPLFS